MRIALLGVSFFMILSMIISFSSTTALCDQEPNNSFENHESLERGKVKGWVYIGLIEDVDVYRIPIISSEDIIIKFKLLSKGLIRMEVFSEENKRVEGSFLEIDSENKEGKINVRGEEDLDEIFLIISGSGEYEISLYQGDSGQAKNLFSFRNLILLFIFIMIGLILIFISLLFFKEIKIRDTGNRFDELEKYDGKSIIVSERLPPVSENEITVDIHDELKKSVFE